MKTSGIPIAPNKRKELQSNPEKSYIRCPTSSKPKTSTARINPPTPHLPLNPEKTRSGPPGFCPATSQNQPLPSSLHGAKGNDILTQRESTPNRWFLEVGLRLRGVDVGRGFRTLVCLLATQPTNQPTVQPTTQPASQPTNH